VTVADPREQGVELILASASPRRGELIALLGVPFRIVPSRYEEPPPPLHPVSLPDLVMKLASEKALEVAGRTEGWILGADTLVSLEEEVGVPLGKPVDERDACRMIRMLAGRSHFVFTGIALIPPRTAGAPPRPVTTAGKTRVWFRDLTDGMIEDYVATGEPLDKAGAYGAQGFAAPFIERIDGDFHNVVGLPLCDVGRLLERSGLDWSNLRTGTTLHR
jgi:septum formation protein